MQVYYAADPPRRNSQCCGCRGDGRMESSVDVHAVPTPRLLERVSRQTLFEAERLRRAAWACTTRRAPSDRPFRIRREAAAPRAGDLVLARVDFLGHHQGLQLGSGRKRSLFPGDEIVVVYG